MARRREEEMATIDSYEFGRIVIDGSQHDKDVIILPNAVVANWWRKQGHSLVVEDLEEVLDDLPGRLVVGTGAHGRMRPDRRAVEELERRGIAVEALPTPEAIRRYGELDPSSAAAALHLTC
jgi:hypothetical protein